MSLPNPRPVQVPGDAPSWATNVANDHNAALLDIVTRLKTELDSLTARLDAQQIALDDHETRIVDLEP